MYLQIHFLFNGGGWEFTQPFLIVGGVESMKAELITVGTELLMGQVINTNSATIARELAKLSIPTYYQQTVGDNSERILESIQLASGRSDLIILCGGLGPTTDDITKQVLAQFVGKDLVEDKEAMEKIIRYHEQSHREMSPNNRLQALAFDGGKIFKNHNGLAIGGAVETDKNIFIVLPGPPSELMMMLEKEAVPYLKNKVLKEGTFVSRYLRFFGIGESRLVTDLEEMIDEQTNPTIAPYAGMYEVVLRLTANGGTKEECEQLLNHLEEKILAIESEYFYGYGEYETLLTITSQLLKESSLTIASAESLTGGLFASTLISVEGSSQYVLGSCVAYQEGVKKNQLQVPREILETYGMVSIECAEAMAENVRQLFGSDLGISFTGIAGPSPMEGKEVGTVFVSLADGLETKTIELHLARNRNGNREYAVQYGLNELRKYLLEKQ